MAGVAVALGISESAALSNVKAGKIPSADYAIGGEPRWQATTLGPLLSRLGKKLIAEQLRADAAQACADGARSHWARRSRAN